MYGLPIPQDESKLFPLVVFKDRMNSVKMEIPYQKAKKPKLREIVEMACNALKLSKDRVIICGVTYYENKILSLDLDANEVRKEYKYRTVLIRQLE